MDGRTTEIKSLSSKKPLQLSQHRPDEQQDSALTKEILDTGATVYQNGFSVFRVRHTQHLGQIKAKFE
jgi:hypothetical protein